MPASFSDYLENKLLDHVFGATAYAAPATLYIGLLTVAPTDAGGGTEVAGGSYARAAVVNNVANFPNAAAGAKTNGNDIVFATATANWGTVVAVGIYDALAGGNLIGWCLVTNQSVPSGVTAKVPAGQLNITLD
jgi:hypothetical protein